MLLRLRLERVTDDLHVVHQVRVRPASPPWACRSSRWCIAASPANRAESAAGSSPSPSLSAMRSVASQVSCFRRGVSSSKSSIRSSTSCSVSAILACAVVRDRLDPLHVAVAPRRIGRHRDDAGIQAAEPGDDELQPRRIEQQRPLAGHPQIDQPGRDRPRMPVELLIRQARFLRSLAVGVVIGRLPAAAARSNSAANRSAWWSAAKTGRRNVSGPRAAGARAKG